ncbi:asparagine synthase-related protein [Haliangium sp.]|uniref:asparagine synthase-related protein n=1 Tax=Haliangium sp. TaxID=2663208 RepID=UPI003D0DCD17
MPGLLGYVTSDADAASSSQGRQHAWSQAWSTMRDRVDDFGAHPDPGPPNYRAGAVCLRPRAAVRVLEAPLRRPQGAVHVDEHRDLAVAYIGRFYDAPFDRSAPPAEVARALCDRYAQDGERFLAPLSGSFLIWVHDGARDRALVANDHYGSLQLFYHLRRDHGRDTLLFAPQVRTLVDAAGLSTSVHLDALVALLVAGKPLATDSMVEGVYALPGGSLIVADRDGVKIERVYEALRFDEPAPDRGPEVHVGELADLLAVAMRKRAPWLGESAVPLSGGYDSRGLLLCAARVSDGPVRTLTWGRPGGESEEDSDPQVARLLSLRLGTQHHFLERATGSFEADFEQMFALLDGLTDDCALHPNEHALLRRVHDELGVDGVFIGNHCFGAGRADNDAEAMARIGIHSLGEFEPMWDIFDHDRLDELCERSSAYAARALADCPAHDFCNRKDYLHFTQYVQGYATRSSHYKQLALVVDNPWLDRDILAYLGTIPPHYRIHRALYKQALAALDPEIAAMPYAVDRINDSVEDWDELLATGPELQRFVRRHLLEDDNGLHQLLDRERLRAYIDECFAHAPHHRSLEAVAVDLAKRALRRSPHLYRLVKRQALEHVHTRELRASTLLFRLLVAKRVYDRFGA